MYLSNVVSNVDAKIIKYSRDRKKNALIWNLAAKYTWSYLMNYHKIQR